MTNKKSEIVDLPRGGHLVKTSVGNFQFGVPPETIKDTMLMPEGVPDVFLLPGNLFHIEKGIAIAELEFPIYFNHFLKQKKVLIIGTAEQCKQLKAVLQESVFGPVHLNIANDFAMGESDPTLPDMQKEMAFFRGDRVMEDVVQFGIFEHNEYKWNGIVIRRQENLGFFIYENFDLTITLPWTIPYNITYDIGQRLSTPFIAPDFAITCLGPSHGFDPRENTSGFILWLNGRGIMIDPPVNSTEWLRDSNVNPKLISHVILTHCHADHDAGTFQKILEENTISIHTTQTVMESFMRKYTAMTKIPSERLMELFRFHKVLINEPIYIENGEFIFHYTLHSIPTIGFKMRYNDQSFVYSSDHLNHPDTIKEIAEKNIFSQGRLEFLLNFPWDYNIIYHEAGIPPLHTPVSYLASLPEEIQKKITVYHIAAKDFPTEEHSLTLAKFGMEHTLFPPVTKSKFAEPVAILDVMTHVDLFNGFSADKAREFLTIVEQRSYHKGEKIIEKGTKGSEFYMIVSGVVSISNIQSDFEKIFEKYDYFGEASLVTERLRAADVIAQTEVELLVISKGRFLNFIEGTKLEEMLLRLAHTRESNSWDALVRSPIFTSMTSYQKTQLEGIMKPFAFKTGQKLIAYNQTEHFSYILIVGEIELTKQTKKIKKTKEGDFIGDVHAALKNTPVSFEAIALSEGSAYRITETDMSTFLEHNPGIYLRLLQQ